MSKFYSLTVGNVKKETRDTIVVSFDVPPELKDTFHYQQGQHLTLRSDINGEDLRRSYSICSAVQDQQLRVAIKRTPGVLFDLGQRHAATGSGIAGDAADGPLQHAAGRHQ